MRLRSTHETTYRYDAAGLLSRSSACVSAAARIDGPARSLSWRVAGRRTAGAAASPTASATSSIAISVNRTHERDHLAVEGEVETTDTAGIVRGGAEPLPPAFYLRQTPLTAADAAIEALAAETAAARAPSSGCTA